MAEVRFPYGYGTATATMAQLEARYGPGAPIPPHPEYWRRIKAWLISRGGQIGIGGAYRFTQPDMPGFAPPGMSFHERQRFASGFSGYSAIDLVAKNGSNRHRSPRWDEVPKQGSGHADIRNYGVHCNVSGEPWHIQCIEQDGYQGWVNRGRPDPVAGFPIFGGGDPVTPPPPPSWKPTDERVPTPTLREGDSGPEVAQLQDTCRFWGWGDVGNTDGKFGARTKGGVQAMQSALDVARDGIYGPNTAKALQAFFKAMDDLNSGGSHKLGERTLLTASPVMSGNDVEYVQKVCKAQGLSLTVDGWYGAESANRVKSLQGWNGLTKDGICGPQTWTAVLAYPKP